MAPLSPVPLPSSPSVKTPRSKLTPPPEESMFVVPSTKPTPFINALSFVLETTTLRSKTPTTEMSRRRLQSHPPKPEPNRRSLPRKNRSPKLCPRRRRPRRAPPPTPVPPPKAKASKNKPPVKKSRTKPPPPLVLDSASGSDEDDNEDASPPPPSPIPLPKTKTSKNQRPARNSRSKPPPSPPEESPYVIWLHLPLVFRQL
ncbi:hypothetical protein B0H11DRAFT_14452 [Mycena galericulata]|nr:hypothetical protein B0H11DRAFT_432626 [Mycena galericulata]KAJ7512961.1 hypothetical protein B0H11DRAFT_14452 [Mycena galericulata]